MPFLGVSAIEHMARARSIASQRDLQPRLAARTTAMPVVPDGARHATINVNGIERRAAGRRHPDAVRRRPLPRGVRSAVPDRGRLRRDEGGDRRAARRASRADVAGLRVRAARSDGRAPDAHAGSIAGHWRARRAITACWAGAAGRWPARAPTITSTSRGSPASRLRGLRAGTDRARASAGRIIRDIDDLVSATKVIALALLELTGTA